MWTDGAITTTQLILGHQLASQYAENSFNDNIQMSQQQNSDSEDFQQEKPVKARYTKTSMKKKEQLIDMVMKQNYSIYRASKKLKISNSTAKSIIKNYERLGVILQRNSKSSMVKLLQNRQEEDVEIHVSKDQAEKPDLKKEQNAEAIIKIPQDEKAPVLRLYPDYRPTYPFLEYPFSFFFGPFGA